MKTKWTKTVPAEASVIKGSHTLSENKEVRFGSVMVGFRFILSPQVPE